MDKKDFLLLIEKYLAGQTTVTEEELLIRFYQFYRKDDEGWVDIPKGQEALILDRINGKIKKPIKLKRWLTWSAAAIILFTCTIGIKLYIDKNQLSQVELLVNISKGEDILPGEVRATLKLADGRTIRLDDAKSGTVADELGVSLSKTSEGQLVYTINGHADQSVDKMMVHTVETPRGGQYQIKLPDGTRVWLNASSTLSYSPNFEQTRAVQLQGEAYFEVAKDKKPFIVNSRDQAIQVLGTHFNVSAYPEDQKTVTTLLEGKVNVSAKLNKSGKGTVLEPNSMATTYRNTDKVVKSEANIESAVAWKNGYFQFNEGKLTDIMATIARWYDVEVEYESLPDTRYTIYISRGVKLSEVLTMLEITGGTELYLKDNKIFAK